MNVPPATGLAGSAAGAPLSQTKGSESERSARDAVDQVRQFDGQERADKAAGIGQMEQDAETNERDADGRRLWEKTGKKNPRQQAEDSGRHRTKDPTGESGNSLDVTG